MTQNKNKKNNHSVFLSLFTLKIIGITLSLFLFFPHAFAFADINLENELMVLTNLERKKNQLNSLTSNPLLHKAAAEKAADIYQSGSFNHTINGRKFSSWIRDQKYDYAFVGENLAVHFQQPGEIIKAWMNSELHRKNILNPQFQEIGLVFMTGSLEGIDTLLAVQIFGTPSKPTITSAMSVSSQINQKMPANNFNPKSVQVNKKNIYQHQIPNNKIKVNTFFILSAFSTLPIPFLANIASLLLSIILFNLTRRNFQNTTGTICSVNYPDETAEHSVIN